MNRKTDTGKTLKRWPVFVDHYSYETKDLVDVVTGDITTIQSLRHTSDLDTGEMYVFLCKVEAWAMNIGCHLTIPPSCEFQLLRDKQEA
ncbi:DLP12 prophage; DNA base-flipping protein [Escherichia coli]|uniref:DLP12 prophage DNA base-flipping protein n=1 Tax=Escherichia coli TaxID=562 RepID=A0A376PYQ0_ECOLX|nr:DLP12 prophage; DNA base-flipping protein [Escherichia coli]STH83601.1 DLP12 prophage; DNA base-flipping protein [Escherichia coli]STL86675.1 DLP12 prophage; DNA base-flipping protein [Escherichia coli]